MPGFGSGWTLNLRDGLPLQSADLRADEILAECSVITLSPEAAEKLSAALDRPR